jgi:hypothetical protein
MFLSIEIKSNTQALEADTEHATARILRDIAREIELGVISGTPTDATGHPAGPPWSFVRRTPDEQVDIDDDQRVAITAMVESLDFNALALLLYNLGCVVPNDVTAEALRDVVVNRVMVGDIPAEQILADSSRAIKRAH